MEVRALAVNVIGRFNEKFKGDSELETRSEFWKAWMGDVKKVFSESYLTVKVRLEIVKLELNLLEALIVYVDLSIAQVRNCHDFCLPFHVL